MQFLHKKKDSNYVFLLDEMISVVLSYNEPPFYSKLELMKDGHKQHDISVQPGVAKRIHQYFQDNKKSNIDPIIFIEQLKKWGLEEFASKINDVMSSETINPHPFP